ncbi:MAG: YciK family oxidoreductase [Litorivicinus sp.]|mgnify:CR=1 FL=1
MNQIFHADFQIGDELNGQVHLVTGATRGIGEALCWSLARAGATVLMLGRDEQALEALYDAIMAESLPEPVIIPIDLETLTLDAAEELAGMIDEHFGKLNGLIHNAGILGSRTPVSQIKSKEWEQVQRVNVDAVLYLTQGLMPLLETTPHATLILTSSGVGAKARAYWGAYAVSKFAVEGLAQLLAEELENTSTTRVFCVDPGATRTAMRAAAYPGETPEDNPTPEALMPFYLWLLSRESESHRGQRVKARM